MIGISTAVSGLSFSAKYRWLPQQETGVLMWLRGDMGATVSQWSDQSGNGKHATQAVGGNQPTISNINSRPAFSFVGAQWFTHTLQRDTGTSICCVAKSSDTSGYGTVISTAASAAGCYVYAHTTSALWGVYRSANVNSSFSCATARRMVALITAAAGTDLFTDGTKEHSVNQGANVNNGGFIGATAAGALPLNGLIGEIIVYDHIITDVVAAKFDVYAKAFWGL